MVNIVWFELDQNTLTLSIGSTLSMMPYSTASLGLKYFGRLMSASICSVDFPTCLANSLTYNIKWKNKHLNQLNTWYTDKIRDL